MGASRRFLARLGVITAGAAVWRVWYVLGPVTSRIPKLGIDDEFFYSAQARLVADGKGFLSPFGYYAPVETRGAPDLPDRGASARLHRVPEHPGPVRPRHAHPAAGDHGVARLRDGLPHRDPGPEPPRSRRGRAPRRAARRRLSPVVVERLDARARDALRVPRRPVAARGLPLVAEAHPGGGGPARVVAVAGDAHPLRRGAAVPADGAARRSPSCRVRRGWRAPRCSA